MPEPVRFPSLCALHPNFICGIVILFGVVFLVQWNQESPPAPLVRLSDRDLRAITTARDKIDCIPSHSQSGEETIAKNQFFSGMHNGTYVEIGGLNGIKLSNTLMLHTCLRWNGLLVEANPRNFEKMRRNVALTRPNAQIVESAVCKPPTTSVRFTLRDNEVSAAWDQMSDGFKQRWHNKPEYLVDVHCEPMSQILQKANLARIDLFSLDVEGAELIVLETIDFSKVAIGLFIIEFDGTDFMKERKIRVLLRNAGYVECAVNEERNAYFLHKDYPAKAVPQCA